MKSRSREIADLVRDIAAELPDPGDDVRSALIVGGGDAFSADDLKDVIGAVAMKCDAICVTIFTPVDEAIHQAVAGLRLPLVRVPMLWATNKDASIVFYASALASRGKLVIIELGEADPLVRSAISLIQKNGGVLWSAVVP